MADDVRAVNNFSPLDPDARRSRLTPRSLNRTPLPQADYLAFRRLVHAAVLGAGVVVGVGDFGDVDVALGIGGYAVGRGELVYSHAGLGVAQPLNQLAVGGEDGDACAEVGDASLDRGLDHVSDVDLVVAIFALSDGHRVVDVPLVDVFAVEGEDLDAEVFAVGDDDLVVSEH